MSPKGTAVNAGRPGDSTWGFVRLVRRLLQGYGALWTLEVSPGLTSPQFGVLSALSDEPGMDQRSLGERISVDRSTIADVVNRLARRDLIAKVRDPNDGRRDVLSLTPEGRRQLGQARTSVDHLRHKVFASFTDHETEEFVRLLQKLVECIEVLRFSESAPTDGRQVRIPALEEHRNGKPR